MKPIGFLLATVLLVPAGFPLAAQSPVTYQKAAQAALQSQASKRHADCPDARTTVEENACLDEVRRQTEKDFDTFSGSLESLLAGDDAAVERFRGAEKLWKQYREKSCDAIDALYQGGSIQFAARTGCHIALMRSHMLELDSIYRTVLHN